MGFESWHAQDDGEPIYSTQGHKRTVYLLDDRGNLWTEDDYIGYGDFAGKNFHQLIAEMNIDEIPPPPCESAEQEQVDEHLRIHGIEIMHSGQPYKSPNLVHEIEGWEWTSAAPAQHEGQGCWEDTDDYVDAAEVESTNDSDYADPDAAENELRFEF